jgi:predicted MFS family arabinose efflux permease
VNEKSEISRSHAHYALGLLTVTYVFNFLDRQLLAILVEPIKAEFGVSDTAMGVLYGFAFALFYATLAIPVAALADRSVRRNILAVAAGLWSLMTVLCGFAAGYWQLLATRIGVAVGEAGGVPPSQSLVADYYPPEKRATAMAIFSSGTFIGTLLALVGGAYLAQNFGWRTAFIVVGAPGLLLAVLIRFTIKEPPRGAWDKSSSKKEEPSSIRETMATMWRLSAMRYTIMGCSFACIAGYGIGYWTPSFLIRVYGLSLVEAGLMVGALGASIGLLGSLFGGWLCDRLSLKGQRWRLLIPALSLLLSLPLMSLFFVWPESQLIRIGSLNFPLAIFIYSAAGFVGSWWAAPTYVVVQALVAPGQRTLACAVLLLAMNLLGFGLGPVLIGGISDLLTPSLGTNAIRYALLIGMVAYLAGVFCYWMASRVYDDQLYDRPEQETEDAEGVEAGGAGSAVT